MTNSTPASHAPTTAKYNSWQCGGVSTWCIILEEADDDLMFVGGSLRVHGTVGESVVDVCSGKLVLRWKV